MEIISKVYRKLIEEMVAQSREAAEITPDKVYQQANLAMRPYIYRIIEDQVLPGSGIFHPERLYELKRLADTGASCLIFMEHYSNFDLPNLVYFLEKLGEEGKAVADSIVAIAGFKLNTENAYVRAFTEAFSRIVIYPSRSLAGITDPEILEREQNRSRAINLASMRVLSQVKAQGKLILIFPAGTRYRIGNPETKRGVKEVDSYLKSFDYFLPISINGNILHVNPVKGMDEDLIQRDVVIYNVGEVRSCSEFRERVLSRVSPEVDSKQAVVDEVMRVLDQLHEEAEVVRKTIPGAQPQEPDFSAFLASS